MLTVKMMTKRLITLSFLVLIVACGQNNSRLLENAQTRQTAFASEISDIKKISDIKMNAALTEALSTYDEDTLVIFDLDNTVMMPNQYLGTHEWFDYLTKKYMDQEGLSKLAAGWKARIYWNKIQRIISLRLVEDDMKALIKDLQRRNFSIMGHTARSVTPTDERAMPYVPIFDTLRQLEEVNIDLSETTPVNESVVVQTEEISEFVKPAVFSNGILFCENNDKGLALVKFFEITKKTPKKVIFFDDRIKNLESMKKALATVTNFYGIRYGGADTFVSSFNSDVVERQMTHFEKFGTIISNEEAK